MGREAVCMGTWKRQRSSGKALLETASLVFRGGVRVDIWTVRPKGVAEISESAVRAAALAAGLGT
jgi:hypothetical protein